MGGRGGDGGTGMLTSEYTMFAHVPPPFPRQSVDFPILSYPHPVHPKHWRPSCIAMVLNPLDLAYIPHVWKSSGTSNCHCVQSDERHHAGGVVVPPQLMQYAHDMSRCPSMVLSAKHPT